MENSNKMNDLLRQSKIASVHHGDFAVNLDNLKAILSSVSNLDLQDDIPVAIVAVMGPKSAGKSFLTNFLIQYFKAGGEGSWMSKIIQRTKKGDPMMDRGYAWDSVNSEKLFKGEHGADGIYLWLEPYLMSKDGKENAMLVWIMHMDIHEAAGEAMEPLAKFLALTCSTVLEIKCENDEIQLLEIFSQNSENAPYEKNFCKSVTFVIRSNDKQTFKGTLTDEEAKEKLLEMVKDAERKETYKNILEKFENVSLSFMPNALGQIHNQNGVLNEVGLKLLPTIKKIVSQAMDDQEVSPKATSKGPLTLAGMEDFMKSLSNKATASEMENETNDTNEETALQLPPFGQNFPEQSGSLQEDNSTGKNDAQIINKSCEPSPVEQNPNTTLNFEPQLSSIPQESSISVPQETSDPETKDVEGDFVIINPHENHENVAQDTDIKDIPTALNHDTLRKEETEKTDVEYSSQPHSPDCKQDNNQNEEIQQNLHMHDFDNEKEIVHNIKVAAEDETRVKAKKEAEEQAAPEAGVHALKVEIRNAAEMTNRENLEHEYQKEVEDQKIMMDTPKMKEESKAAGRTDSRQESKATHSTSPDNPNVLPPLIFHLQSSRITMAMDVDGDAVILKNESGENQTLGIIAWKAKDSTLIYGNEALAIVESDPSTHESEVHFWSIADFFMTNELNWNTMIQIDGVQHRITTEFLLAFLLGKLKTEAELQMNGRFEVTVIAVPYWLSSPQRVKVKDAAKLAGFMEVHLVNEASVAAFNLLLSENHEMGSNKILVLSESLDRVDAFVYEYSNNGSCKQIQMLSHTSHYEFGTDKNISVGTLWKGLSAPFNYVIDYLSSREQNKNDDQITAELQRALSQAHAFDKIKGHLYICEKQEKWSPILQAVCNNAAGKASDFKMCTAVISGTLASSRYPKRISSLVRDKLNYDILRRGTGNGIKLTNKDRYVLPIDSQKQTLSLPMGHKEVEFYQFVLGEEHAIGKLFVRTPGSSETLEPVLEVTSEGIVRFKDVKMSSLYSGYDNVLVSDEDVIWTSPNLSPKNFQSLQDLLVSVLGTQTPN